MASINYRAEMQRALHQSGIPLLPLSPTVGPQVVRIPIPLCGLTLKELERKAPDIAIKLAQPHILVEQWEGTTLAAIQVPRPQHDRDIVTWEEVAKSTNFTQSKATLPLLIGLSIEREVIVKDFAKAPHAVIAGRTGGGKSVALSVMIVGMALMRSPSQVRFVIIDPKFTEFTPFENLPHLVGDIVDSSEAGIEILHRLTEEMDNRNRLFKSLGPRNITEYNGLAQEGQRIPNIVVVIDELAELMMTSKGEVKDPLQRLLQKGRSSGVHIMMATQHPTSKIVPTELTANAPTRIAFATSTDSASRVILGENGAESLQGRGDMLVKWGDGTRMVRAQAPNLEYSQLVSVLKHVETLYEKPTFSGWLEPQQEDPVGADIHTTPLPNRNVNRPVSTTKTPSPKVEVDTDQVKADEAEVWIKTNRVELVSKNTITGEPSLSIGRRVYPRVRDILIDRGIIGEYNESLRGHKVLGGTEEV